MTSRRKVSSEKTVLDKDDRDEPNHNATVESSIAPAVPAVVIYKLLGFTLAMVAGPIGTYFLTLNTVFHGNSTWAGATAAVMANVVLVAYIIVAFQDDESERIEAEQKAKKGR